MTRQHVAGRGHGPEQRTARFWVWLNDGWVRLSLRPGQSLTWGHSSPHDAGYGAECLTWERHGTVVRLEWARWGRDCDGGFSREGAAECPVGALDTREAGDGTKVPAWGPVRPVRCWDEYAETAGY